MEELIFTRPSFYSPRDDDDDDDLFRRVTDVDTPGLL